MLTVIIIIIVVIIKSTAFGQTYSSTDQLNFANSNLLATEFPKVWNEDDPGC